ncbi:MAG: hypothetical protein O6938_09625 [Gammaproteobacteria bacterium]|nr:hypothetical protein [Gammaproteobacteria bacterium]
MIRQHFNKMSISLLSALLVLGLVVQPAQADHYDDVIVPLAAGIVLGSIFYHGHRHHHQYSKQRHGYYGHSGHHGYQNRRRAYSTGHGGYSRKSHSRGYSRKSRPVNRH